MDRDPGRGVAVALKRYMELTSEAWTLHWTFAQVEMERKRRLISPDAEDGTGRTESLLVDLVVADLTERTTYIEPPGWPGAPVLLGRGFDREREGSR